jgi:hypothetical protein
MQSLCSELIAHITPRNEKLMFKYSLHGEKSNKFENLSKIRILCHIQLILG